MPTVPDIRLKSQSNPFYPGALNEYLDTPHDNPPTRAKQDVVLPDRAIASSPEDDVVLPDQPGGLQQTYDSVSGDDPDQAAKIIDLSQKFAQPEEYLDKNADGLQKSIFSPDPATLKDIEKKYPKSSQFLSEPKNMVVAKDDLHNVTAHEDLVQQVTEAKGFLDSLNAGFQASSGGLLLRGKTPNLAIGKDAALLDSLTAAAGGIAGDLPAMLAGGVAGSVMLPGLGSTIGAFEAPAILREALMQDYTLGKIKSPTDLYERLYKISLAGTKGALTGLVTGVAGIAGKAVGGTLGGLAAETVAMPTASKGLEGELPTPKDILENALLIGAMHGVSAGAGYIVQERQTQKMKDFYLAFGDNAEASKLRERLPEKYQQHIQQATEGTPVENAYSPIEKFDEYFQSKNIDPAKAAADMGALDSYTEAKQTGGSVKVPWSDWVNKLVGTEHFQGLADDVKFSEDALTPREAKAIRTDTQAQVEEEVNNQEKLQNQADFKATAESVGAEIDKQLLSAGVSEADIPYYRQLYTSAFHSLAKRSGVDPLELFKQYGVEIKKGNIPDVLDTSKIELNQDNEKFNLNLNNNVIDAKELFRRPTEELSLATETYRKDQIENFKARFGEKYKQSAKAIDKAQNSKKGPYVSDPKIDILGWAPNYAAEPTGVIGPAHISEPNPHPIGKVESDPLKWADDKYRATKFLIEAHKAAEKPLVINTSSDLVSRVDYIEVMPKDTTVNMYLLGQGSDTNRALFPGSPSRLRQESAIEHLRENGIKVNAIEPTVESYIQAAGGKEKIAKALGIEESEVENYVRDSFIKPDIGKTLFQGDENSPRGKIQIGDKSIKISLLKGADKSTFLHETGHFYLEVIGDLANQESAPQQIKDDYQTILKFLGVESRDQVKVDQHEKWASAFETYLKEGKAPSAELKSAFSRFKSWLVDIYKNFQIKGIELTPEVREVMDRILATDEEIANATKESGYTDDISKLAPESQASIQELQTQAREKAEATLLKEQLPETKKEHKAFLAKERERLTKEAESQVKQIPIFKAQEEIKGSLGTRDTVKLANRILEEKASDKEIQAFTTYAEINDFPSGEELAKQILMADSTKLYQIEVESRVNRGMAEHKDLKDTAGLRDMAMEAIHNDRSTELLALEQKILQNLLIKQPEVRAEISKRNRATARIEAQAAKEQAHNILSNKSVKDASNSRVYVTAERKASERVALALRDKDFEKAAEYKRQQMLNHALAAEAMRNEKQATKIESYLTEVGRRGKDLLDAPYAFVRQVDALLGKAGLREASPEDTASLLRIAQDMETKGSDPSEIANVTGFIKDDGGQWRQESLPEFVSRVNDDYYEIFLPDSVVRGGEVHFSDMSMAEASDLYSATKTILGIGKGHEKFLTLFDKQAMKLAAAETRASIEKNVGGKYAEEFGIGFGSSNKIGDKVNAITSLPDSMIPSLVNLLTLCEYLDKKNPDGPMKNYVYRVLTEGENKQIRMHSKAKAEIDSLMEKYYTKKEMSKIMNDRFNVDGFSRPITHETILSMALNWGNDINRDRLLVGYNLNEAQVRSAFDRLSKKDWDFVQSVWDHIDTYWPEASALEMRVRGVQPEKVERSVVETKFGTYEGGYYPIEYDPSKSAEAYKNSLDNNALYKQQGSASAMTNTGYLKSRATYVNRPLRLDLGVIFNHVDNLIHDLSYREAVIDVSRFLKQPDVKNAIQNAINVKGYRSIVATLEAVASKQSDFTTKGDAVANWFRFNATFATLALRVKNLPMDMAGNSILAINEVGMQRYAAAVNEFVRNPKEMHEFITNSSEVMKNRTTMRDRDVLDMAKKWRGQDSFKQQYGMFFQAAADHAISEPLWNEVYKRNLSEFGHKKAVAIADETIKKTFGSGSVIDLVGAQRGNAWQKLTTMYYSWSSMMFNRAWLDGKIGGLDYNEGNRTKALAVMAKSALFLWGLTAINENFWKEFFRNSQNPDDESMKKRIVARTVQQPFSYVWLARDFSGFAIDQFSGMPGAHFSLSPVEQSADTILKGMQSSSNVAANLFGGDREFTDKDAENAARAAAVIFKYPQEINNMVFNFHDWLQDNGDLTWRDLVTRRTKK